MVYGWKKCTGKTLQFPSSYPTHSSLHRLRPSPGKVEKVLQKRRAVSPTHQGLLQTNLSERMCFAIYMLQLYMYVFPQGKADWLNNHVQRWLRRNHRHQIRLVIHFMHGPTIVLAIVRARPFTRNGFTMHGFMNVFLFMRGHLYILYGSQSLRQENFKLSHVFQKACFHMRAVTCINLLHTWQLFGCRSLATMHACMAFLLEFIMQNSHMHEVML